jgi:hypothetical protein
MAKFTWIIFQTAVVVGAVLIDHLDARELGRPAQPGTALVVGVLMAFVLTLVPITLLNWKTRLVGVGRIPRPPHRGETEGGSQSPRAALRFSRKLLQSAPRLRIGQ